MRHNNEVVSHFLLLTRLYDVDDALEGLLKLQSLDGRYLHAVEELHGFIHLILL
jgi:hypothetical protein